MAKSYLVLIAVLATFFLVKKAHAGTEFGEFALHSCNESLALRH